MIIIGTAAGAAIASYAGDLTPLKCTVHANDADITTTSSSGGVLFVSTAGTLTVTDCSFFDNAAFGGGAIAIGNLVTAANLARSTIAHNLATGSAGGVSSLAPSFTLAPPTLSTARSLTTRRSPSSAASKLLAPPRSWCATAPFPATAPAPTAACTSRAARRPFKRVKGGTADIGAFEL